MKDDFAPILHHVGRTPLVRLQKVVPHGSAEVWVKVEGQNPTGSMKDRMALGVINGALSTGRLGPGKTLVEYSGGSTGTSLAFFCAAHGLQATIVTSDAFSREKRDHMRALGAKVIEIPSEGGRTTKALIEQMIATAKELSDAPHAFFADQFRNPDAADGYEILALEILASKGKRNFGAFVQSVGTGQCIHGVSRTLRDMSPNTRMVAVEPAESPVLSGGRPGAHKIEGVGPGFVPPLWNPSWVDDILTVSTEEAMDMTRRLAKEEALFAGTSSGANVTAAVQVAKRLDPDQFVVTLLCDNGLKYLSTELYA